MSNTQELKIINKEFESLLKKLQARIENEMLVAEHKQKMSQMEGHDSEYNFQWGRYHCALDLNNYLEDQLSVIMDKNQLLPSADNQGYKKTESEYYAFQKGVDAMKNYILSSLFEKD